MLSNILERLQPSHASQLFDEDSFYAAFIKDINKCMSELIIESAYMTTRRVRFLLPHLLKLKQSRVRVVVNTRSPQEHDAYLCDEARESLALLLEVGVHVIFSRSLHRKTAIVDRSVLWEGSLNILSQNDSREVMRRTESVVLGWQMVKFSGLDNMIG